MLPILLAITAGLIPRAAGHASIWHPSMFGFNVTETTFPYDNRPVAPLADMTFAEWWFHGHLDFPPNAGDVFDLPAGQTATAEVACDKGATSFFTTNPGGDIRLPNDPDNPCPGSPLAAIHTTGLDNVKGCAMAISYKSDANQVQPEDFAVFSVNQTCVWTRFTDFQVPARMPACPEGGCTCAWFWIHSPLSGSMQNYMNGFRCNVTGATSTTPIAAAQIPRRCGADPDNGITNDTPGNCTFGAKQPFYWFNRERNNMFEGTFSPPFYTDLYNFRDGAQNDIFQDSYVSIPVPGPNQTALPVLADVPRSPTTGTSIAPPSPSVAVPAPPSNVTQNTNVGSGSCVHSSILPPPGRRENIKRESPTFRAFHMTSRRRRVAEKRSSLWHIF